MSTIYDNIKTELDKMSKLSEVDFKSLRKVMGVSQSEFAALLDVDIKTVSRIELGHCRINARMAFAVRFLSEVYRRAHNEYRVHEFESRERERQRQLREAEFLASRERLQERSNHPTEQRFTHGPGKRKKKKKR